MDEKRGLFCKPNDSCKGMGDIRVSPQLGIWGVKQGDVVSYVVVEDEICSVEITEDNPSFDDGSNILYESISFIEGETPSRFTHF